MDKINVRLGITPVGSPEYRFNRLRCHLLAYSIFKHENIKHQNASFIIRCDDSNIFNINYSFLDEYLKTLKSLGVEANKTPYDTDKYGFSLFQSKRTHLYNIYMEKLKRKGLILEDETGVSYFNVERFSFLFSDMLDNYKLKVSDAIKGELSVDIREHSNIKKIHNELFPFPIKRSDGRFLFNFCSPIDDGVMEVTHVVRDHDKLPILAKQEMIRISLNFPKLNYVHLPLLVNNRGIRFVFDEDLGNATLENFKKQGFTTEGIISYLLSSIGGNSEEYCDLNSFSANLKLSKVHKANTKFSLENLKQHNKKSLKFLPKEEYLRQFYTYLEKNKKTEIQDKFSEWSNLITEEKRDFKEMKNFLENLITPKYNKDLLPNERNNINKILKFLIGKDELFIRNFMINNKKYITYFSLSNKEYFHSLRYILTGEKTGLAIDNIIKFLQKDNQIYNRVQLAQKEMFQYPLKYINKSR